MKNFKLIVCLFISAGVLYTNDAIHLEKVVSIPGYYYGDQFGSSISNIGDINNDGFNDLAVTCGSYPDSSYPYPWIDRVDVFYGGSPFDIEPDITLWEYRYMGAVTYLFGDMDLNGDSYTDYVLSNLWAGGLKEGRASIYLGSPSGPDSIADLVLYGEGARYGFGYLVTGDLNADGYDDLIITAPDDWYASYGRVYIYLGGDTLDDEPDWYYQSPDEFANYGSTILCGDMNNDGYDDWIVSTQYAQSDKPAKLYIYSGGDTLSTEPAFQYESENWSGSNTQYISGWNNSEYGILLTEYLNIDGKQYSLLIRGNKDFNDITIDTLDFTFSGFVQGYLNDDENKDILVESGNYNDTLYVCAYLNGNDFTQPDTVLFLAEDSSGMSLKETVDLNGDSIDEVIFLRRVPPLGETFNYIDIYSQKPFPVITDKIEHPKKLKPDKISLKLNYPNPFNVNTVVPFEISTSGNVKITVYDLYGREITILTDRYYDSGKYSLQWNAGTISSGVYFIQMKCENAQSVIKTVLLK
ncbi:MAG: hypothetical protein COT43_00340 [Candidatus Marinimicrobia bacterium CG08_land_8_20_14_0_20_45_22]|nr:MAG: hypothetical protein COT43_00340 [Candidatus Marinimicrobia bacterium CG08_land_8_20_14_0_20_45_22]